MNLLSNITNIYSVIYKKKMINHKYYCKGIDYT